MTRNEYAAWIGADTIFRHVVICMRPEIRARVKGKPYHYKREAWPRLRL